MRDEAKSTGPLRWTVKRDSRYLVPTILHLMTFEAAGSALRRPLKITFDGEAGVDEGGILSEVGYSNGRAMLCFVLFCLMGVYLAIESLRTFCQRAVRRDACRLGGWMVDWLCVQSMLQLRG